MRGIDSARARARAQWSARARVRSRVLAGGVLLGVALVIFGWYAQIETLVRVRPDAVSMKLLTAVGMGLVAGGVLAGTTRARMAWYGGAVVLAAAVLWEHTTGLSLGIDQLLVDDWSVLPREVHPGRPAEASAATIGALGVAGLLSIRGHRRIVEALTSGVCLVAFVAVLGYVFDVNELYSLGSFSAMSVPTALTALVVATAVWTEVPGGFLQWLSYGEDSGARLLRVLVPQALLVLPLIAWALLQGHLRGRYGDGLNLTVLVTVVAAVLLVGGYRVARASERQERQREELLQALHHANAELEDRVRSRSLQLNRQRTKLALLEERDRIARDLHDRVIQRVFAAGLQVAGLSRTVRKERQAAGDSAGSDSMVPDGLDAVAVELDMAIRELRNSIFQLTSVDGSDDLEDVIRDIAVRASRILGYMPRVEIDDETPDVHPDLMAQLASVTQEGLSNVARHARASAAAVQLTVDESAVTLRISDNGAGLPDPLPRSSGVSNLINRARNLGGDATWTDNHPTGTVLTWWVPRAVADSEPPPSEPFGGADDHSVEPARSTNAQSADAATDTSESEADSAGGTPPDPGPSPEQETMRASGAAQGSPAGPVS